MAVGNLIVNLIAKTSLFDRKMRGSRKSVRSMTASIERTQRTMRNMARGVIVLAGVGGLGLLIKRTMDSIDATAKLSDRLEIGTEDLVAIQHAAKIMGVETAGVNKALETMVRRLGEVRQGTGEAKKSLDLLGLSADEMATKSNVDNLKLIADRLQTLPTIADKAVAAYQIFGRQGQVMLNLLMQGGKGIEDMRKEADRLGITFSRLDAAKVEEANDAITRTKAAFKGMAQDVTIVLAPMIEGIANSITAWATSSESARDGILSSIEDMVSGIAEFGKQLDAIPIKWKAFQAGMAEGFAELAGGTMALPSGRIATGALDRLFGTETPTQAQFRDQSQRLMAEATQEQIELINQQSTALTALEALREKIASRRQGLMGGDGGDERAEIEKQIASFDRITEGIDKQAYLAVRMNRERDKSRQLIELQIAAEKAYGKDVAKTAGFLDKQIRRLEIIDEIESKREAREKRAEFEAEFIKRSGERAVERSRDAGAGGQAGFINPRDLYRTITEQINRRGEQIQKDQLSTQRGIRKTAEEHAANFLRLAPTIGGMGP